MDQLANALTKPLSSACLQQLKFKIGVHLSLVLRGHDKPQSLENYILLIAIIFWIFYLYHYEIPLD